MSNHFGNQAEIVRSNHNHEPHELILDPSGAKSKFIYCYTNEKQSDGAKNMKIQIMQFKKYEFKKYFNGNKWVNKTSGAFLAPPLRCGSQETPPTKENNEQNRQNIITSNEQNRTN